MSITNDTFARHMYDVMMQVYNDTVVKPAQRQKEENKRLREKLKDVDKSSEEYKQYRELKQWMQLYNHSGYYLAGPKVWNGLQERYPKGWKLMMELE